ncbi:hypothetical protein F4679DRAFT_538294 [Xylaria curta]|nr:hypothetical protein F4679DRAFT_538294 [Xylaria curta]
MEPLAKRPRLSGGTYGDAAQPAEVLQQPSNSFEGYGVQNTGSLKVSRDFILNINEPSNTSAKVDKRQRLLESLQFDQMDTRQLTVKRAYAKTCAWFLDTPSYINWTNKSAMQNNFLWIKGKPGAGKSTLMKFLLVKLRNQIKEDGNQEILLSFFFNARGCDLEKTTVGLYRSLLLQLLEACPNLQSILDRIRIGCFWTIGTLTTLFEEALQLLGDTTLICLIDALDECEEGQIRDMVRFLSDPGVIPNRSRICFASRHYPQISIKTGLSIVLEEQIGHSQDIESYLHSALVIKDSPLAGQIRCDLQKKASGVFIWVVLVVDILNREYDAGREHVLRARIQQFPGDLHDLFLDILTRDDKNMDGLLLCIQWVLFAQKPVTPTQLYFAILSGLEPDNLPNCHSEDISECTINKYILNNSKGLAESTKSKSPTIQFIHESVRDFLLKENGISRIWPDLSTNVFGLSHNMLKKCCQAYLSTKEVMNYKGFRRDTVIRKFPFLDYAHQEILYHSDQAQRYNICQQSFLDTFPRSQWVKHHNIFEEARVRRYTPKVSLLYILAETGMAALIRAHRNRQSCFKVENERYGPPVLAASATKSSEAIHTMLELEAERLPKTSLAKLHNMMSISLDISYASGRNFMFSKNRDLFHQLVEYGNEKASIFFLAIEEVDIHVQNQKGKSVLMTAVEKGFRLLVEALLDHGADPLPNGLFGESPLEIATRNGCTEIAKLLLDNVLGTSAGKRLGESLLYIASRDGHIETAKLLLDNIFNASARGHLGESLLYIASRDGHIEFAKLLLEYGADPSADGHFGKSPLQTALENRHIEMANLFLDHGACPSANGHSGDSPLQIALRNGYFEMAKLLLDHGADPLASSGYFGETALCIALKDGNIEMAKLLLDHGADPSANGDSGDSLLQIALRNGHVEIAKLLIEKGADISEMASSDLFLAAGETERFAEMVEMPLEGSAEAESPLEVTYHGQFDDYLYICKQDNLELFQ